jgi:hypothetical protein
MEKYTSTIQWTNALARREINELLRALTDFVNLGDSLSDLRFFRKRWSNFFPKGFYDLTEREMQDPEVETHNWLWIKRALRDLWTGRNRASYIAPTLLGIRPGSIRYDIFPEEDQEVTALDFDWKRGEFIFASCIKFHQAVWFLLRQPWRARACRHCEECFVAKRQTQLYCSSDCSELAEKAWKREWWRKHGDVWRAKRSATHQGRHGATSKERVR